MRRTAMLTSTVTRWPVFWVSLCLFLFVAACTPAPVPSAIMPTASRPAQLTAIAGYHGHTSTVFAVAWSPMGGCLASATGNISDEHPKETVQVWNATTGSLLMSYLVSSRTAYADGTLSVAWSPDGKNLASGSADTIVHLWNAPLPC